MWSFVCMYLHVTLCVTCISDSRGRGGVLHLLHWKHVETCLVVTTPGQKTLFLLLASNGHQLGMQLNTLLSTGQPSKMNYPT